MTRRDDLDWPDPEDVTVPCLSCGRPWAGFGDICAAPGCRGADLVALRRAARGEGDGS